ncbi:PREDICTED: uncharacterized protein LOC105453834 [Wasmannia auropunctata]|uniref:uncharacterized protein LOC105453834 n=1 Tax=Wasmannia auropunctata TaxID=64793 RepID=UPI0005ED685E|nr:PREDICTED: uncharacterized protein LOC105453834 [Wasmannia auropunctata]
MARVPEIPDTSATPAERPMSIKRRVGQERERMLGMTDEERAWRKKWLDAQKLAPEEPVVPKGYYEQMYNPIRRLYMAPGNKFQNMLEPLIGYVPAYVTRRVLTRSMMGLFAVYCFYYHLKYNKMNWTRNGGFKITFSRPSMYPDTKDLSVLYKTKGNQFYVNDFDKSPI